eukprot:scaffold384_cov238-Pinguiococcus_pyrenoidosus.AAC.10
MAVITNFQKPEKVRAGASQILPPPPSFCRTATFQLRREIRSNSRTHPNTEPTPLGRRTGSALPPQRAAVLLHVRAEGGGQAVHPRAEHAVQRHRGAHHGRVLQADQPARYHRKSRVGCAASLRGRSQAGRRLSGQVAGSLAREGSLVALKPALTPRWLRFGPGRHEISEYLVDSIKPQILEYGWDILNVLVTRLSPAMNVRTAMNNINIQQRLKVAQREKAEADKIVDIKRAEGRAEAAYLSGQGISRMRQVRRSSSAAARGRTKERANGCLHRRRRCSADDTGLDEKTAENLVYTTQLFDTMRELSKDQTPDVLYLNPNPSVVRDYLAEIEVMLFGSQEEAAKINFAPADQRAQVEPLEEPWPEFK